MKFNFDNLNKPEPIPEVPQTPEITQEEFDAQIEQEAIKLKTSVEELAKEINQHGGPEEFKRRMEDNKYFIKRDSYDWEKRVVTHSEKDRISATPEGQAIIDTHEENAETYEKSSMLMLKTSAAAAAFATALEILGNKSDDIHAVGVGELVEKIQLGASEGTDYILPTLITIFAGSAFATLVSSIKDALKFNKEKREAKKQELKHKMTGVEFNNQ